MKRIVITTDCVCDITEDMLEQYEVKMIHFYIVTEHGWFKDMDEITSGNIVEYFERVGSQVQTKAPFPEEYRTFFEKVLKDGEEIIHIGVTSSLSMACQNASCAAEAFDGKVHVIDSGQLSTGLGLLVMKAAELVQQGKETKEIINELECMRYRISTSFIAENANYLYRTGHVSKFVKNLCELLKVHPVLGMRKGIMGLKAFCVGNYDRAVIRYAKREMRKEKNIEKERLFITHAACNLRLLNAVKKEVGKRCIFEEIQITEASATISSNCGANTIGLLYVRR